MILFYMKIMLCSRKKDSFLNFHKESIRMNINERSHFEKTNYLNLIVL